MPDTETRIDMIGECCKGILNRIEGMGIKGPKRQADEALTYAIGWCKALETLGDERYSLMQRWIVYELAFQGMKSVEKWGRMENK